MIKRFAALALLLPAFAGAEEPAPLPEAEKSTIGYATVADALAALKLKPGVKVSATADGWTVFAEGTALWSFTPEGHPAHPSAVRREPVERDGKVVIEMAVLCEAGKEPCDQLVRDFTILNESIGDRVRRAGTQPAASNPRDSEVEAFATHWLDLLEQGETDKSYAFLSDIFKSNVTIDQWRVTLAQTQQRLGKLRARRLRRIAWYENPPDAPLPGTYVAVEFDSIYENAPQHFRYVVLHTQGDQPFRVMRDESTIDDSAAAQP